MLLEPLRRATHGIRRADGLSGRQRSNARDGRVSLMTRRLGTAMSLRTASTIRSARALADLRGHQRGNDGSRPKSNGDGRDIFFCGSELLHAPMANRRRKATLQAAMPRTRGTRCLCSLPFRRRPRALDWVGPPPAPCVARRQRHCRFVRCEGTGPEGTGPEARGLVTPAEWPH